MLRISIDVIEKYEGYSNIDKAIVQNAIYEELGEYNNCVYQIGLNWYRTGMVSVFLQDANTMVIKPDDMELSEYFMPGLGGREYSDEKTKKHRTISPHLYLIYINALFESFYNIC